MVRRTGRSRIHRINRIVGGVLAWLMFAGASLTHVSGQQDVDEVDDGDIVLPTVILELDEPASGGLEVALPIDIQVLAPERWPPLPEAGDLDIDLRTAVAAPDIDLVTSAGDDPGHTLVAETFVSIGTTVGGEETTPGLPLAHFSSGLSLIGTGPTSATHVRCRIGAKNDGTIIAADATLSYEAGAFPGSPVGARIVPRITPVVVPAWAASAGASMPASANSGSATAKLRMSGRGQEYREHVRHG